MNTEYDEMMDAYEARFEREDWGDYEEREGCFSDDEYDDEDEESDDEGEYDDEEDDGEL
jgi:hypothetical protein